MKKLTIAILLFCLVGTVIAIGITNKDKTITLSKEAEQFYKDLNITPSYKDYEQDGKYWRCIISNTDFNLPCSKRYEMTGLTEKEKEQQLDNWQKERLEGIYEVETDRQNRQEKETIREGNLIITNEK